MNDLDGILIDTDVLVVGAGAGGLLDVPTLLAQADEALYAAKENGRNRVEVASLQLVLDHAREGGQRSAVAAPAVTAA